ncbi:MAG: site-2 protease family protein [Candidatus Zixiibacteriota bacterium]|nr:MAG: site-2 protease family protein [candidate division Zixibacteria bacterium]
MIGFLQSGVAFVFVLGVLIFIHELGHFIVAKRVGIRVDAFSLGFPPNIFARKWRGTEYRIGIIPLGGYVKMAGENPDEKVTGSPDEFMSKSVGQRFLVIFAGPLMNYLFAVALSVLVLMAFGARVADTSSAVIGSVIQASPAEEAGLQAGDVVLAVNGQPVGSFDSMAARIHPLEGQPVVLTWAHGSDTLTEEISTRPTPVINEDGTIDTVSLIGVGPAYGFHSMSIGDALTTGFVEANLKVALTAHFAYRLIVGEESIRNVGGPVFIAQASGEMARRGLYYVLSLMILLSVNLAVLNILPIPVLDGGQLAFLGIEVVRRGPLSAKTRMIAQQVGVVMILSLILVVFYNDIMRLFTG